MIRTNNHSLYRWSTLQAALSLIVIAMFSTVKVRAWSMGPVGGDFEPMSGSNYLKVNSVTAGGPGDLAGLQAGDYIYKTFGESLTTLSTNTLNGWKGSVQEFGDAIENAEAGNGILPLTVLREGTGNVDLNVQLTAVGGFGPAYPLGSTKFDAMYQKSCSSIHTWVDGSSDGDFGYNTGLFGIILLSHPDWNSTTGAQPYRLSINKLKDRTVAHLAAAIVAPVEPFNMDGTPNDGSADDSNPNDQSYVSPGLENWDLCTSAMFIAEYRRKTGDTSVDSSVQLAADILANRVQDHAQPPNGSTPGPTNRGMMGHGGVFGDYAHAGWLGLNIINAQALPAMAMLKGAGATVDGVKFQSCWDSLREGTNQDGGTEDGNVGYSSNYTQGGWDSSARTAGAIFAMENYGGISAADQLIVDKQKAYVARHWQRMQHAHTYTLGGVYLTQFALPYLDDRSQRHIMENLKFYYQFQRDLQGELAYFSGRVKNGGDFYLNTSQVALISVGITQAVQSGNLPSFPAVNTARVHADFASPNLTWPSLEARHLELDSLSQVMNVNITDYQGTVLNAADYTASWTHISGPAVATFTSANTAGTTVNFPQDGTYRIQLEVVKGAYTLIEPIDVVVDTTVTPAGYVAGKANYRIYTDISGANVADLTGQAKYPNSPDMAGVLTSLDANYDGDNYGQRIAGYIIPKTTGNYTFYIASDDTSEFRLNSAGTAPAGATSICSVNTWTSQYQWTKEANQTSASVSLTAGQSYYFEVLHKEGAGGHHCSVGWTGPGIATTTVIPGSVLAIADTQQIVTQPTSQTASLGDDVSMNVSVEGAGSFLYEWFLGSTSFGVQTTSTLTLSDISVVYAGNYHCVISSPNGTMISGSATLTIDDAGLLVQGGLWRDQFDEIGGTSITDLTDNSKYPQFPTSGSAVTIAEGPVDIEGSYGARYTGWITPDVTGDYYFYIASDDASQLWLSTDEQPSNKVNIASVNGYTGTRAWSSGGKSVAISLTAGERYYVEILHKEGGGDTHCAVAWQKPGEGVPVDGAAPIAGQYLEYITGGILESAIVIPPSLNSSYNFNVTENVGSGASVGTVLATDDSGNTPITYSIVGGNSDGMFTINGATGEITTLGDPDYESVSTYTLRVNATNNVGARGQTVVNVTVQDIVDGVGSWADAVDLGTSALVKQVTPLAGNTTTTVDLSGISGDATYEFLVNAEDAGQAACDLLGANGWSVRFEQWNNSGKLGLTQWGTADWQLIAESGQSVVSPYGSEIHMVYVVDSALAQTRLYVNATLVGTINQVPNFANVAAVLGDANLRNDAQPGIVGFAAYNSALVPAEITAHYDGWRGVVQNTAPVVNDATFTIAENTNTGIAVGTIVATDAGDTLTYAITAGNAAGNFSVNTSTGQITTAGAFDFETTPQYVLTVSATDTGALSDTATITVNVTNVNEAIVANDNSGTLAESAAVGSAVATVAVSDPDAGDSVSFAITGGNTGSAFAIDASGNITTATGLNFEITPSYSLTVTATDGGGLSDTATVTVTVTNVNEAIVANDNSGTLAESAAVGSAVVTVAVSDPDAGDSVSFAITGGNTGNAFAIDANGNITTATGLNYEATPSYSLTVTATDGGGLSDTATVTVVVTNVNEAIVANDGSGTVAEDVAVGSAVATVTTSDADAGDSVSFAITGGNTGNAFAIDSSGNITTATSLDFGTTPSYSLTVTATDGGGLSDTATVTVTVTNVNADPVFTADPINVAEALAGSAYAGQTLAGSATDADQNTSFTYSKVSGPAWLQVAADGALSGTPSTSDLGANVFTVQVNDGEGGTDTATLNADVVDKRLTTSFGSYWSNYAWSNAIDGDPASFAWSNGSPQLNAHITVEYAQPVGPGVIEILTGDPNNGGDSLANGVMETSNDGVSWTTVATFTAGEAQANLTETAKFVRLRSTAAHSTWLKVREFVLPTNAAPVVNDSTTSVAENISIGGAVATLTATDANAGDALSYAITAGNAGGEFAINAATGEITTAAAFDFETTVQYTLTVTVSDDGTPSLSDTATITVNVTNVNEAIVANDGSGTLAEDAVIGSAVATVTTSDPDAGDSVSFAITSGNADGAFVINSSTGAITTAKALDYESATSHSLTVTATDGGGLADTATISVNVTNINEAPIAANASATLAENVAIGSAVATVGSSDPDAGDSVSYAITAGNTGGAFAINSSTGAITTAAALDYETATSYVLTVTVTDGGSLADTATVSVTVTDVVEVTAPTIATGAASNIAQTSADIAYTVSDDGGEASSITVYYGKTNGGTTAANWESSSNQGAKSTGAHSVTLSDLTEGTTYYFSVLASNSAGSTWASTGSFTSVADQSPKMVRTTVSNVSSSSWTSVDLGQNYNSAVIVATPIYANSGVAPVVTRIRNVSGSGFEVKIDRADGLTEVITTDVSIVAVEEGVYTQAVDGITMEAVKYTSTVTAENSNWTAEARTYQNSYTTPVVVGQVMSANDANWSTFWCQGASRTSPPSATALSVGKHVGEDSTVTRANETIGYIVIESGTGTINGVNYVAGLGSDIVKGTGNTGVGYNYSLSGLSSASAVAASLAGMDGGDGGWAVLYGANPFTSTTLTLAVDEDQLSNSERSHTSEQVGYIVFE